MKACVLIKCIGTSVMHTWTMIIHALTHSAFPTYYYEMFVMYTKYNADLQLLETCMCFNKHTDNFKDIEYILKQQPWYTF